MTYGGEWSVCYGVLCFALLCFALLYFTLLYFHTDLFLLSAIYLPIYLSILSSDFHSQKERT